MKRRVLTFLLTGAVLAGLLAGCTQKDNTGTQADSKTGGTDKPADDGEGKRADAKEELTTVKILCKNDFSADIKTADWEKYPVSKVVISDLEKIGIRLELECIDNDSFANAVQTRIASGVDIPDLIAYCWAGAGENDVLELAKNGLVYPVNELVDQYDEDGSIKAFYDEKAPGVWEQLTAADGNLYWFTYLAGVPNRVDKETGTPYVAAYPHTLSIRKDWLEAVGEEVKDVYTPKELADVVKKMQDADVNGNGLKDEVIFTNIDKSSLIGYAYGLNAGLLCGWFEEQNEVFSNFYHENFPAYIQFMQSLYQDGLIDTAMLTMPQDEMVSQNRVAVASGYAVQDAVAYEDVLPGVEDDKSYYIPVLLDTDGDLTNGFTTRVDSVKGTSYCQYFVPKGAQNVEAVARLMDYVYTDAYAVLNQLGLEGTGYERDENGNYVDIVLPGDDGVSFRDTSCGLYALPSLLTTPLVVERYNSGDPQYKVDKAEWVYKFRQELFPLADQVAFSTQNLAMPTEEESAFISEKVTVLETYASELLADLILGNKSLDNLPGYLEEMEELGLKEYIDIMQARRDRLIKGR